MLHQEGLTVVFQNTTRQQLKLVVDELKQRHKEVHIMWNRAQELADCTDQIDNDLDGLYNALENVLSDFEVDGFFQEEAPRYNRWLEDD